jgi:hypothetical protein
MSIKSNLKQLQTRSDGFTAVSGVARRQGGLQPAAVFYPFGHPCRGRVGYGG